MAHKAHKFDLKPRTQDVRIQEDVDFRAMLLPDPILEGLHACGFIRPSPIQLRAIPLARCGFDLIIHAKSGTGKTCVFTVAALDLVQTETNILQVLILAPTREICMQLKDVIKGIGCKISGLRVECFIGGMPVANNVDILKNGCHIAVGTLGRVKQLVDNGHMITKNVRLLVLDEFDKLMDKEHHEDINSIYATLPESKQILVSSATYPKAMVNFVKLYMTMGTHITPNDDLSTVLLGIRQFVSIIPYHVDKLARTRLFEKQLFKLLSTVSFDQCFVFTNYQTRAESICSLLRGKGWSADWIAGIQTQSARTAAIQNLRNQKVRVLVTTDLTARGIDAHNVNLIINLDTPYDHTTYLHRMGRAGRFGSYGMVITILSKGEQVDLFRKLMGRIGGCEMSVNVIPTKKSDFDLWKDDLSQFEKIFGIEEVTDSVENKSEINDDRLIGKDLLENCAKKCTFPNHIKCSDICLENSDCLFVTNKLCKLIQECEETIYYDKIPLNVPLAILGEKLIRLNKFPFDSKIFHSRDLEKLGNFLSDKLFAKEEKNFTLKDFSEIERSCNEFSVNEKDISLFPNENIVTEDKDVLNQLSGTVNDVLLSVLQKDEKTKNICKLVNCFDLLTWSIVDKDANIVKRIETPHLNIIEFKTEKCESTDTEKHIRVVKFGNLETFLKSLKSAETIEFSASKQIQTLSINNICTDIKLYNIIDASKYLMNLDTSSISVFEEEEASKIQEKVNISQSSEESADTSAGYVIKSPTSGKEASEIQENINISQSSEEEADTSADCVVKSPTSGKEASEIQESINISQSSEEEADTSAECVIKSPTSGKEASEIQENINISQSSEEEADTSAECVVKSPTSGDEDSEIQEKLNISRSFEEPADSSAAECVVKSPTSVFEEKASKIQETIISQSSEEPADNSSSNRLNDENDTAMGKQDSSIDEKSLKKVKRKDGFGRNAKHISEMYPNVDIEEEKSFPNIYNKSSTSETEEKVLEKKADYKRKVKRKRQPRTDNKHELFRSDRKNTNNDKCTIERKDDSGLDLSWRVCNNDKAEVVENINLTRNNKEKSDTLEQEHNLSKKVDTNYAVQVDYMKSNLDDTCKKQLSSDSSRSDRNVHKERYNQNLKRNKEESQMSEESSEKRLNIKKKSYVRKVVKKTMVHDYNSEHSDNSHHHYRPQGNFQNQFQNSPVYLPSQQQWGAGMYPSQQWSEAYSQWYQVWHRQIRTISQYVEYSTYMSNMLQRK